MAVTLNTIPAQSNELVRMLITVGVGGANTPGNNRNWWRLSSGQGSVSADSDVEIDPGLIINRVLWHASDELRFFKSGSGSFNAAISTSGVLAGKSFLIAVNDTDPPIDAQFDVGDASVTAPLAARLSLNANSAQQAAFNTVVTGGLVNIVISDVPGTGPPAVVHDVAASLTAGAPSITAIADKEIPAAIFDTAASLTAGPPTLSASAELVGLAQEFHDTAAEITAGAAVIAAVAEIVEGGIREITAEIVAGPPSIVVAAESVGLAQPFHDTAAAFEAGPPSVAVSAQLVGLAQEFHDVAASVTARPPSLAVLVELDEAAVIEVVASLVAGVPQIEVAAVAVGLEDAFHDVSVSLTAGAPSLSAKAFLLSPSDRTGPLANSLTRGVVSIKRTLLRGGLLRSVQWHRRTGEKDVRGRQAVSVSLLDALIEQRPALNRGTITTVRSDDTVLTILDPVAIKDTDLFRWGNHTYKVSKVDGVIKNEVSGVRFSSEVTVIR